MTTGEIIFEYRKKASLTQEELADKLGVSRQAVSKWEQDAAFPETEKILELCKLFSISADELLFGRKNAGASSAGAEREREEKFYRLFRRFFRGLHLHAPAEHFGIGIGSLSQKVLVVGADGEERGINARKLPAIFQNFVPAQIYGHVHLRAEVIGDRLFNGLNVVVPLYHVRMLDTYAVFYTLGEIPAPPS